jgi:signal transduction histidine kinase/ActR/RegA family two-component response regulator
MLPMGVVINMISAGSRTEELLSQLQRSNTELETRTRELEEKARQLEDKNREIAEASASLEEKARQLSLVSRYKSEFLANMSHELRTPLNSMLILANLLSDNADGGLTAKQVEYAKTIYSSGRDLLALISQILDLSKIEAGRMSVERRRVPLAELRRYLERSFGPVAQERGLDFLIRIEEQAPPTITTDLQRLEQILKNLLSNAFKFTPAGRVALQVSRADSGLPFRGAGLRRAPGVLAFTVTDTGIGIPPEKQQLIFEAFQQADASTSRTYGGTGLGLTISRELARLLGGELSLESTPGSGSSFTLYLPLSSDDMAPLDASRQVGVFERTHSPAEPVSAEAVRSQGTPLRGPAPDLAGRRVLIVDDDARNLFAVTSLLERHGAEVVPAVSGGEALAVLDGGPVIDLVLMDVMMPGMDGYAATREIRKREPLGGLPVVALTAKAMPGDREKCIEAGCTDFLAKPVDPHKLLETVARLIQAKERSA